MAKQSQYNVKQSDVTKLVKQGKSMPAAARELGVPESAMHLAYYEGECVVDPSLRISGTDAQVGKKIAAQRKEGVRWVRLAVRSGKSIPEVKRLFKSATGQDPDKTWTGRGRKPAGAPKATAPAKKAGTTKGAAAKGGKVTNGQKARGGSKARTRAERQAKSKASSPS